MNAADTTKVTYEEGEASDLEFTSMPIEDEEPASIPLSQVTGRKEPPFQIPRGKYKGLVLPRMIGVKPSMLQQVQEIREQIIRDPEFKQHASSIAQTYLQLRFEAEEKKAELDEIRTRLTACMLIMNDQFEVEDTLSLGIRDVGTIRVQPEPHAIVMDKEAHRRWCLKNGYEGSMVLPWGTTNRITKEMLMAAHGEPDGVEAFMRPKVVFAEDPAHKSARAAERARKLGIALTDD